MSDNTPSEESIDEEVLRMVKIVDAYGPMTEEEAIEKYLELYGAPSMEQTEGSNLTYAEAKLLERMYEGGPLKSWEEFDQKVMNQLVEKGLVGRQKI